MAATERLEELLRAALAHALAYRASLPTRPVAAGAPGEDLDAALAGAVPEQGRSPADVLDELVANASPGLTAMSGPRFFGWVTGGTLDAALAADWMTSIWDQNAGPASGAPAAAAFERCALRWVVELLNLPGEARGALVTGASAANFAALAGARSHVLRAAGWDVERDGLFGAPEVGVLVGQERHDSIDKALRLLGFGTKSRRCIDADGQGRLSASALARELARHSGPLIVCAQLGNVNSGAFDPMPEIASAIADHRARHGAGGCWLHVDGAFGLWARAAAATAGLARGAELADSWATDAHKFLNVPYDCGIVLTRHPQSQRRAMAIAGAYLSSGNVAAAQAPSALVLELSRRARSFALWAALRQLGRSGLAALVTRCVALAQQLSSELARAPGLCVENAVVFNQVVLSATPPPGADRLEFTRELAMAIQADGTCYATPTVWRGKPALRFSVINASTRPEDIARSAAAVRRVYQALV